MSLPQTAEVLIVGAGPAGVTLALALQKHGCADVVIVDAQLEGQNTSRSLAMHAATVETLESIGLADRVVAEGRKLNSTSVWTKGYPCIRPSIFSPLGKYTKYPFVLGIAQHIVEQILEEAAKERQIIIHRPFKVTDLKANEQDNNFTDVIFDNGHVLRARCVVGADGARSTVRKLLNISFTSPIREGASPDGNDPEAASMIVADVTLDAPPPLSQDAINLVLTPDNAMLFVYFPGNPYPSLNPSGAPVYRIATGVPPALGAPPSAPGTEYLQSLLDAWGPTTAVAGAPRVRIVDTLWSSRFRTHSALAARYVSRAPGEGSRAPVCLLGDAAHIHPPMGGQGMNLGMRDAGKLAPVLAAYVRAAQADGKGAATQEEAMAALEAWGVQRRARALEVIKFVKSLQDRLWIGTKRAYFLGFIPYNPAWVQITMLRILTSFQWFQARSAWMVSGLADP